MSSKAHLIKIYLKVIIRLYTYYLLLAHKKIKFYSVILFSAQQRLSYLPNKTFVIGASSAILILILTIALVLIILKRKTALKRQDNQQGHQLFLFDYLFNELIILFSV